jgi:hypothetical protein
LADIPAARRRCAAPGICLERKTIISIDSPITFGKYQGFTPAELAATDEGCDYLNWGKENLRSPQWASAFADALKMDKGFNESAVRKMAEKLLPENDEAADDPERFIEEYVGNCREQSKQKIRDDAIYAKYAAQFGRPVAWLKGVYMHYGDDLNRKNFSSEALYQLYIKFCKEIEEA